MIEDKTKVVRRYTAVCDSCCRRFYERARRDAAEWDLKTHKCGEHRQAHDSTGGYRGILGGYNVSCVCGEHWVDHDGNATFHCPKDAPTSVGYSKDADA